MNLPHMSENVEWQSWGDAESIHFAATVGAEAQDRLNAVFSLPKESGHFFLTLSDGDASRLTRVMAHLDECDAGGEIHQSHVVRFHHEYLDRHGYVGVYLCAPKVSPLFRELDEPMRFDSNTAHPTLVIFITESEYEIWQQHGASGLMDHFDASDRDLVSFERVDQAYWEAEWLLMAESCP